MREAMVCLLFVLKDRYVGGGIVWMLDVGDGVCLARESRLATGVGRVG
jgi:hypothetical protein